jgi:hypothetical protein
VGWKGGQALMKSFSRIIFLFVRIREIRAEIFLRVLA